MDVYIFSILFILALVLLLLTFFKKQIIVGVFTGIAFILLGILLWGGLYYETGFNEYSLAPCNDNCTEIRSGEIGLYEVTNTTTTYIYGEINHTIGESSFTYENIVGTFFILFGIFMLFVSMFMVFTNKKTFDFSDDNNNEDEED